MDPSSSPHKNKNPPLKPLKKTKFTATHLLTVTSFLLVIIFQSLGLSKFNFSQTQKIHQAPDQKPKTDLIFHPLKDPTVPPYTDPNRTWFMSTLMGQSIDGMPEHFIFPSHPPNNRVLCINTHKKSYSLAGAENSFPANDTVLQGLTVVVDSFYDYQNPWHSLNTLSVFFSWMMAKGCMRPTRFVVFKNGEVVRQVGGWISALTKACLDGDFVVESLDGYETACFERAVVFRRALGKTSGERRHRLFDMMRCKAWKFCNAARKGGGGLNGLRISLVGREGKRAFRNESGVKMVMERECHKVAGCRLKRIHLKNMNFCDQVKHMRKTDIFATTHGAQLTNMMFVGRRSSVMDMHPRGWLEGVGIGKYIYKWFASWSAMIYEGPWRDTSGVDCSVSKQHPTRCFLKQKDQEVGLNETFLAEWTARVIRTRIKMGGANGLEGTEECPCDN